MNDIVRIVSPQFSSFHDLSNWIDGLISQPVPDPAHERLIVDDIVQVSAFQGGRHGDPHYGATIFVSAVPHQQSAGC